jgi:chromosome segregation ATPase
MRRVAHLRQRRRVVKRIVWLGAAALIALAAAIPLWLVFDGGGETADRRAAALATETDCSQAKEADACSALVGQRDEVLGALAALERQLAALASEIDAWNNAARETRSDTASEAMLEVGKAVVALEAQADAVQAKMVELEETLNTVGDDAQLANVDLQNILQKQQQTLQMMSNISKTLYDTAQSVIRKMGG